MSFIGQVCLHIRGICYSNISSTVQQNDSNRTGHRQQKNNIQIGNVQYSKNTIYNNQQLCVYRSDVQIWNEKNKNVWWINTCIIVLCVPRLMSSVHEMECLGKETVSVSGCSGSSGTQNGSIDQTVTVQRRSVLDVRNQEWFCQPFFSIWISTVLGEGGGLYQWFAQQFRTTLRSLLRSDLVTEVNQTVIDMKRTDSMMAEYNCICSSCGRFNFLSWQRKYR